MQVEEAPQNLIEAYLRRQGLAPSAKISTEEIAAPPARVPIDPATLDSTAEALVRRIVEAVAACPNEQAFVTRLDQLLEEGIVEQFAVFAHLLTVFPEEKFLAIVELIRGRISELPPATSGMLLEGLGVSEQLRPIVLELYREIQPEEMLGVEARRRRSPLGYLAEYPVVIAELLLASERGSLGGIIALHIIEQPERLNGTWLLSESLRLYRDGMRACAKLLASVRPDRVSEGLVPSSERLDLAALRAQRAEEEAWLDKLLAEHPGEDCIPVPVSNNA